jgi:hypothetical protein
MLSSRSLDNIELNILTLGKKLVNSGVRNLQFAVVNEHISIAGMLSSSHNKTISKTIVKPLYRTNHIGGNNRRLLGNIVT